jgi:hypothetical protein
MRQRDRERRRGNAYRSIHVIYPPVGRLSGCEAKDRLFISQRKHCEKTVPFIIDVAPGCKELGAVVDIVGLL